MVWYRAIASDIYFYLTVPHSPLSSYRKKERKGRKRKGREGGDQNANRTYVHSGMQIAQPMEPLCGTN